MASSSGSPVCFPYPMDLRLARREYKFRITDEQAQRVLQEIRERMPGDTHGARGAYPIVSEYYDTAERDAMWERDRRIGNRRKLRVRIYGTASGAIPPSAFLEIKHKRSGVGVKRRLRVPVEAVMDPAFDAGALIRGLQPRLKKRGDLVLAEEMLMLLDERGVRPSIQMRYDRLAYEGDDDLRITFDQAIKCRVERKPLFPDDPDFPCDVLPPGEMVMEVKLYETAPYWLREMTARQRLTRTPFSKYCTALQLFDPVVSPLIARRRCCA